MDIKFISWADEVRLDGGDVYQMVETTAYFEAYRHVLEGLQNTRARSIPFQVRSGRKLRMKTWLNSNTRTSARAYLGHLLFAVKGRIFDQYF